MKTSSTQTVVSGLFGVAMMTVGSTAQAQICAGLPQHAKAAHTLSAGAVTTGSDRGATVRYGIATPRAFAGVSGGYAGSEFKSPRAAVVGFDAGLALSLGSSGRSQICPTLRSEYQRGPNGASYTNSHITSELGIAIGHATQLSNRFGLIPFARIGLVQQHSAFAVTSQYIPTGLGAWGQTNQWYGQTTVGVGLRIRDRLTLTPSYSLPLQRTTGLRAYDQRFGVSATFGIKQ